MNNKIWREKNPDRWRMLRQKAYAAYYERHKERIRVQKRESSKRRRDLFPELEKKKRRRYYEENREWIIQCAIQKRIKLLLNK